MRVVHIAYKYGEKNTGGAAIASSRLHKQLLECGVDSHYVCVWQNQPGKNIYVLPTGFKRRLFFVLTRLLRGIWKMTSYRKSIPLNIVPLWGLEKLLSKLEPDIVHIHWLNGDVASFEQLGRLPYKCVFNLHDLFIINAIAPYPFTDTRFITGFNRQNSGVLERFLFNRKRNLIERSNAAFIGPSEWVCHQCRQSIIGRERKSYAIPNCVDAAFVEQSADDACDRNDRFVIMFGAYGGRGNPTKGFADFAAALENLPLEIRQQCELRIYGEQSQPCLTSGVTTCFLGNIDDNNVMIQELSKADVFAFPSVAETQGMVKVEAMLCGVPVVAFDRTACAEGIVHGVSGWVARDGDHKDFADGLLHYFEVWRAGESAEVRKAVRQNAIERFNPHVLVEKVIDAYTDACITV